MKNIKMFNEAKSRQKSGKKLILVTTLLLSMVAMLNAQDISLTFPAGGVFNINGSPGTDGQVFTSKGAGVNPLWADATSADLRLVGTNNHITVDAGVGGNGTSAGTGTGGNIFIGLRTGYANTGDANNIIGYAAGSNNTGSNNNIFGGSITGTTYGAGINNSGDNNNIIGVRAGSGNSGNGNNMLGFQAGLTNIGTSNNLIGSSAGSNNKGSANNIIGLAAGGNNTGSNNNIFGGSITGSSLGAGINNSGDNNNIIGVRAGSSNSGNGNNFLGFQAGYTNIGTNNNLIGVSAGSNNEGNGNNIIGIAAGANNTGSNNNIIGGSTSGGTYGAGLNNSGDNNNIIGALAGTNNAGDYNNFIGFTAGRANQTGLYNNFLGSGSGSNNTTGSRNVFMGASSGVTNQTGENNTYIGDQAGARNDIGSGNVAIGKYAARGYASAPVRSHNNTVAIGHKSGFIIGSTVPGEAEGNILIGYQAGDNIGTGSRNITMGYDIDAVSPGSSDQLNIGNLIFGTGIDGTGATISSGNIGIGVKLPAGKLDVNGTIYQRGSLLHADYVFEDDYEMESIEEHSQFMWENKHLKAVPGVTYDDEGQEIIEVGSHRRGILEELEKAHVYIEQLHQSNKQLQQRLDALEAKVNQ